jgi:hypothetical protein
MSAARPTEAVVARLARDLAPVRPMPALRRQTAAIAAIFAATSGVALVWLGLHPLDALARGGVSAALACALALIGAGGLALGLAGRVPGRERLALGAGIAAALGLLAIAAVGFVVPDPIARAIAREWQSDCFVRSLLLAVPLGVVAARLSLRGAPWRPAATGVSLALGAAALGSLLVHAACPSPNASHWLAAHSLLPLATGAAVGALAAWRLARRARRGRAAIARALDG